MQVLQEAAVAAEEEEEEEPAPAPVVRFVCSASSSTSFRCSRLRSAGIPSAAVFLRYEITHGVDYQSFVAYYLALSTRSPFFEGRLEECLLPPEESVWRDAEAEGRGTGGHRRRSRVSQKGPRCPVCVWPEEGKAGAAQMSVNSPVSIVGKHDRYAVHHLLLHS